MSRDEARTRRKRWGEWLAGAWAAAMVANLVAALGFDPDGWVWPALRITASAVFTVALVAWIVAFVLERRARS